MDGRLRGGGWFALRQKVFDRDDHKCRNCGASSNLCAHHIVPVGEGGNDVLSNLATLCRECHRRAHGERICTVRDPSIDTAGPVFTVEEIATLCRTTVHPLHRAVVTTLAKTGIGVGELCNLELADIDLEWLSDREWNPTNHPFLRVRYGGQIPYSNRRERVETTFVPVDGELAYALIRWLLVRPDSHRSDSLFRSVSEWGSRLTPSMVRSILEQYDTEDREGKLTPLEFRHFFEERFQGPPPVRGYILQGGEIERTRDELHADYTGSIYSLYRGTVSEPPNPQG